MSAVVVVGAGWIGRAVAAAQGVSAISRRAFRATDIPPGSRVVVASGRSTIARVEGLQNPLQDEVAHLRVVLDAAESSCARQVVVLGSSDVAGLAPVIDGRTAQDPRTVYAQVKAALEDECTSRRAGGVPVTYLRLAPVHGAGKRRTSSLVGLSRLPVIALPNGGDHSTGFILLSDAVRAIEWLLDHPAPAVQSVGGGDTPLRLLLQLLAQAQGRRLRCVPVPFPARTAGRLLGPRGPDQIQWALRLACARSVLMDPPVKAASLENAAQTLVGPSPADGPTGSGLPLQAAAIQARPVR